MIYYTVQITEEKAISDATHIHNRKEIPIAWAYPAEGRSQTTGRFWAFFHTGTESRIAGIINAPWKLNSDRTALVPGDWNHALIQKSVELISRELPKIFNSDDPGSILEAFPRQVDNQDEIAQPLVEGVWGKILTTEILPDGNGCMHRPDTLLLPPVRDMNLLNAWFEIAPTAERAKYIHQSCMGNRERESRLDECIRRIAALNKARGIENKKPVDYKTWIEAIATTETLKAKKVLQLAYDCKNLIVTKEWEAIKENLVIIPAADGKTLLAGKDAYIQADTNITTNRISVASEMIEDNEIRKILIELGVKDHDDSLWEETLQRLLPQSEDGGWEHFWDILRKSPKPIIERFVVQNREKIFVKRNDSKWVAYFDTLLPGGWVSEDDQENNKWLVDLNFHNNDINIFEMLGIKKEYNDDSIRSIMLSDEIIKDWFEYYQEKETTHREWYNSKYYILVAVSWLPRLKGKPLPALTMSVLFLLTSDNYNKYTFINNVYIKYDFLNSIHNCSAVNPVLWLLQIHGLMTIGAYLFPLHYLIYRRNSKSLNYIPEWKKLKPIFDKFLPVSIIEKTLLQLWHEIVQIALNQENVFDVKLYDLWEEAGNDNYVPETLPAGKNGALVSIAEIAVTSSEKEYEEAVRNGMKVIKLSPGIAEKWIKAGARRISLNKEIKTENEGDEIDILEVIPEIKEYLKPGKTYYPCKMRTGLSFQ